MNLALTNNIEADWTVTELGDGSHTFSNGGKRGRFSAGAGTGRSYLQRRLAVRGGETITVKCSAKKISGNPTISIDFDGIGELKSQLSIDSEYWQEYELSYSVPFNADPTLGYLQIAIGVINADEGSVDIANARIESRNGAFGASLVYCMGLVKLEKTGGAVVASINENYHRCGLLGVYYNSSAPALYITTLTTRSQGNENLRPLFFANLTNERLPDLIPKIGQFNPSTGEFLVQFGNGTGSFVDLNSIMSEGEVIYLFIKAEGI